MTWDRAIVEQRCQYNIYFNSPSWNWWYEGLTSNGQAPSTPSFSIATKVMIKQSWHNVILGYKVVPIIRGWLRCRSTFWGLLTFVVSWYAWHDISILLWCCHHSAQLINLQVSFICFLVHLILGLSASSLVTLQLRLMYCLCKPFPPQKPHILLCCSVSPMIIPTWK
jgi:hypothetical protein